MFIFHFSKSISPDPAMKACRLVEKKLFLWQPDSRKP